ncbi:hypothetical protein I546_6236 [Mycobacterium kansasii 732]|nr:hypothetical protein I546_6236 [Mycobacterium kansasii 732]
MATARPTTAAATKPVAAIELFIAYQLLQYCRRRCCAVSFMPDIGDSEPHRSRIADFGNQP